MNREGSERKNEEIQRLGHTKIISSRPLGRRAPGAHPPPLIR